MGKIVGLDLGTYYSSVAVVVGGKAEAIQNKDGTKSTHSVVSFPSEQETLVGNIAYECEFLYPNETVKEVKRIMGKEETAITVRGGTSYSPQQISAMILKSLCADVEREFDEPVEKAVITIPATFDSTQRAATLEAAKIAGIEVIALAEEPLAALVENGNLAEYVDQCVTVIDIGGGTSDGCSVEVKEENGKIILNCICIAGDTHLGGYDFDRALYDFILKRNFTEVSLNAEERVELKAKCEIVKRKLSEKQEAEFKVIVDGKRQKIHITRKEFEDAAAAEFDRVQKFLNEMKGYKIPDRIILCGGSTRIPKIEALIKETFQNIPVGGENRDLAVAEGAAILAQMYVNGAEQPVFEKNYGSTEMDMIPVKVNMVSSKSYGIAAYTMSGKKRVCNMIYRNEALPIVRESNCFAIKDDHTSACTLCVYESTETEKKQVELEEAIEIGKCNLRINGNNGNLKAGTPLYIRLEVGTDGILHIMGREKNGNTEVRAEFKTDALMSDDEIEVAKQLVDNAYAKVV